MAKFSCIVDRHTPLPLWKLDDVLYFEFALEELDYALICFIGVNAKPSTCGREKRRRALGNRSPVKSSGQPQPG